MLILKLINFKNFNIILQIILANSEYYLITYRV